jgi:hypothetical protein
LLQNHNGTFAMTKEHWNFSSTLSCIWNCLNFLF